MTQVLSQVEISGTFCYWQARPDIQHLNPSSNIDAACLYGEPEFWLVLAITDILEMKAGQLQLPECWSLDDMEVILQAACCNLPVFQQIKSALLQKDQKAVRNSALFLKDQKGVTNTVLLQKEISRKSNKGVLLQKA